ncbi:hypothetical protein HW452_01430 [Halomonas aquamarina]|uniref:Uncharacterized protein n=1 Tax=Vreelandella aquamarina TaxID=77097 RepID=A0ACC5VR58_9GAMM|nr:hypothetical protein [Halomonas aquamarina]MBZ5486186.1 hypothetical protein [Halomonas aquamarina]
MNSNALRLIKLFYNGEAIAKEAFLGAIISLILSKDVFANNTQVFDYINEVFGVSYLPYLVRSRTLMSARLTRHIILFDKKDVRKHSLLTYNYIIQRLSQEENSEMINLSIVKGKRGSALSNMDKWIDGILKDEKP